VDLHRKLLPYMEEELAREGVERPPKFVFVKSIVIGPWRVPGLTDMVRGEIYISAEEVDEMLEAGFPESFVRRHMAVVILHELKHYKDMVRMSPEGLREHLRRYAEDPEYHERFEDEATDFAIELTTRIRRELGEL